MGNPGLGSSEHQLYDLKNDPQKWNDLSSEPTFAETKQRLQSALEKWHTETDDPLADPAKLQKLMDENDAAFKVDRRSPKDGWQILKYLAP